jgi:hypothetical protein
MIEEGRRRPGGDAPNLRWIVGAAESAPLGGPYALVTAGAAMHWMRWQETFGRPASVMTDGALLAIGGHGHDDPPGLEEIIVRYSRSPDYDPDFRGGRARQDRPVRAGGRGRDRADAVPPAHRGLHRVPALHLEPGPEWMDPAEAAAFDREVAETVAPFATEGWLDLPVTARFSSGRAHAG